MKTNPIIVALLIAAASQSAPLFAQGGGDVEKSDWNGKAALTHEGPFLSATVNWWTLCAAARFC